MPIFARVGPYVTVFAILYLSGCTRKPELNAYHKISAEDISGEADNHQHHAQSPHRGLNHHSHTHESSTYSEQADRERTLQNERPSLASTNKIWTVALLVGYCVLVVLASLCGGWLPDWIRLTHTRTEMMVSLVGGLMLGIGVFHMLPHACAELGSVDQTVWWMMIGLLSMFFLIRTFHFHQHGPAELVVHDGQQREDDHHGECDHEHHTHAHHNYHHGGTHELSWLGVFLGLALHTLIDGLALGASVKAEAGHGAFLSLFGLGTFLAILLHKPLDAVSITSLMITGGWSRGWRNVANIGFALMCPLGAGLFFLGIEQFSEQQHLIIGCALAFAAGVFLCISLGDLLPEMEFHSHNRVRLSLLLLLGVALAYGIGFLEPEHVHERGGNHGAGPAHFEDGRSY